MEVLITLIVVAVLLVILVVAYESWAGGNRKPVAPIPYAETPWPKPAFEILNAAQKLEEEAEAAVAQVKGYTGNIEKAAKEEVVQIETKVKTKAKKVAATAKADVAKVKTVAAKIRRKAS